MKAPIDRSSADIQAWLRATCEHADSPRCPRVGCLSPHGACVSEGTTSAQRINEQEDEAAGEMHHSMQMLVAVLLCMFAVSIGGIIAWVLHIFQLV